MTSPLDISAQLPIDTVTVINSASVSVWANKIVNAYNSHVTNSTQGGYSPDHHTPTHIIPNAALTLTTTRAGGTLQPTNQQVTNDMLAHMWCEVVDNDFTAGTFGSRTVAVTLANLGAWTGAALATMQNPTGSTIAARDALGQLTARGLAVPMYASSAYGVSITGIGGNTNALLSAVTGGSVTALLVASTGAVTFGSTTAFTGTATFNGNVLVPTGHTLTVTDPIVGNITGSAATITGTLNGSVVLVGTLAVSKIADFAPSVSATPGGITIAGGRYVDSGGAPISSSGAPIAAQTALLGSQPSTTNNRWVAVYLQPASGAYNITGSADAVSPSMPITPVGNFPVAYVYYRGTTGNPSNIIAAGDIYDFRNFGGGGGGGGTGASATLAYVTNGDLTGSGSGPLANSKSIQAIFGGTSTGVFAKPNPMGFMLPRALDATLHDAVNGTVSGAYYGALVASGTQIQMVTIADVTIVTTNNLRRNPPGTITTAAGLSGLSGGLASASGVAGTWRIYADFGTTGPTFGITLISPTGTPGDSTLMQIGTVWWTGTAFKSESIIYTAAVVWQGGSVAPKTVFMAATASGTITTNLGVAQFIANAVPKTIAFAVPTRAQFYYEGLVTQSSSAPNDIYLGVGYTLNGGAVNIAPIGQQYLDPTEFVASKRRGFNGLSYFDDAFYLVPGEYTFAPYIIVNNITQVVTTNGFRMHGTFWAWQ